VTQRIVLDPCTEPALFKPGIGHPLPVSTTRADRLATLYFFHPLQNILPHKEVRIPILMYHSISNGNRERKHPYYQTTTGPEIFAEQMRFLYENQYSVIGLSDLVNRMIERNGSERCVVITFDDGFRDFYSHAMPVLSRYGFNATVFLPTRYIGDTTLQFRNRNCLTWTEVRELHRAGVRFGSHTVTHPQLRLTTIEQQKYEIRQSKASIEDEIGAEVESFCYPFAFPEESHDFTQALRKNLNECGYKNGVCTVVGTARPGEDMFFLKRLPINSWDDLRLFRAKLDGGYDWLHWVQYSMKFAKARIS
jgi:peptidoglycan/xylan/chitin deacetylase (PgdA/CDA1 family)